MSKNVMEWYNLYNLMPSLQAHMLRVAAVSAIICDHISMPVEKEAIISACLLHDMGNILKFKLDLFPQFLQPEGIDYWQEVKAQYKEKYGPDEHVATYAIAKEIGVNKRVLELLEAIGFSNAKENYERTDFAAKIAMYADMRVEPHGIVSLEARLEEGNKRYFINKPLQRDNDVIEIMSDYLRKIEKQIFEKCDISPEFITDESTQQVMKKLKEWEL